MSDEHDDGHGDGDDHGHDHHHDSHGHDHGEDDHDHGEDDHDHEHGEDGHDHHHAHDRSELGAAVVTISSTRSLDEDPAGDIIVASLEDAGHDVVHRELVADAYDNVQGAVDRLVDRDDVDVVVTTGGTGVTPDDVTVEAVRPLFEKSLPGFGELFRTLSYEEVGTRIVGTRATAGIADGVPVFCLPGSENAARLGIEDVILPEAPHLAGLAQRGREDDENDADA